MPEVQQLIPNLLGGVSQQPATVRDNSEAEEQINGLSDFANGLSKRPASQHSAVLSATPDAAYSSVHAHTVDRTSTDRYRVILCNGDLKVFDAITGAQQTVTFPNGKAYLNTLDPAADFRCVTVGDCTYITNGTVVVAKSLTKSAAAQHEALVSVRSADFSTQFTVTIDSTFVSYTTPDGSTPADRLNIGTEKIAANLLALILGALGATFSVTQYGSTLYIKRIDGAEFSVSAGDGLADQGILAIKGSVQRFDSLPDRAKNGFIVEVTGDPSDKFDNYFVKYNDKGSPNLAGVWEETVAPGILNSLDASTMPHQLIRGSAFFSGIIAGSIAAPPVILLGPPTTVNTLWDHRGAVAVAGDPNIARLLDQQEECNVRLTQLDGTLTTVRAWFDISTVLVKSGQSVTVELWLSNAPSATPVAFSTGAYTKFAGVIIPSGLSLFNQKLEAVTTLPVDTRALILLSYSTGVTPSLINKAFVGLHVAAGSSPPSIEIVKSTATQVRFDPNGLFPTACVTTLTVGATPYAHTSLVDETGAQVAAALQLLVGGAYTATIIDAGIISITQSGHAPVCAIAFTFNNATTLYNPDLNLIVNQLVGQTVANTSDGSSGVVVSNTPTTIVVGALAGGTANAFVKNDVCDVLGTGTAFVFGNALWKPRKVGDLTTIPFPSIVGMTVDELFFYKNRLGMAAKGHLVLSQSGDSLNLFRQTATLLLPDDPIDVKSTMPSDFHSAVHFNNTLMLWSSNSQTDLRGAPLTPETIALTQLTQFVNSTRLRPFVSGRKLFFARGKGSATQVHEYSILDGAGVVADAEDITKHIPTYIKGSPIQMAGDSSLGFLAVLTDADQSKLYIHTYHAVDQTSAQRSWSRWEFSPGTRIVSIDCIDGKLGLYVSRPLGVYLEIIDLDPSAI